MIQMDISGAALSLKANAFSIASLMSGPGDEGLVGHMGGYAPTTVPPQGSTDCCFDWGLTSAYGTTHSTQPYTPGLKGMEGKLRWNCLRCSRSTCYPLRCFIINIEQFCFVFVYLACFRNGIILSY